VVAIRLVDTHCHLDFHVFNLDRDEVVRRAREAGVIRIVNPGIDITTSELALELVAEFSEVYAAVGIHPNELKTMEIFHGGVLKELLGCPKVVAVGEIGLDYYREKSSRNLQVRAFELQLQYACEGNLPVIIHNREASEDILSVLKSWHSGLKSSNPTLAKNPGVLHSFSGTIEEAISFVEMGFLIGITGPVTFKNAKEIQNIVSELPIESLLIETDAPFLTPHPWRGKRNEPAYVRITCERIAELRETHFELVAEKTSENAFRLFQWRETF
jgi:TatD DNase family protein